MKDEASNGTRTHEPSLRELTAELDGVRALFNARLDAADKLTEERDKWYSERDKDRQSSVDKALTAVKEQTKASFDASEKAIVKAEEGQKSYNSSHNDLARKMDEQNKATMPRTEAQQRFDAIVKELSELKAVVAAGGAALVGGKASQENTRANLAILVAFLGLIVMIVLHYMLK